MNLKAITRTYISKIRPDAQSELNWFRQQSTLTAAIEHAALAINSKGKRYSHQRRLKRLNLEQAREMLVTNENLIKQCKSFDELIVLIHDLLESVTGVGELYIYDTAFRIGAKLNLFPTKIHLHAGTRKGAQILGFDRRLEALKVNQLPEEFHELEPYEIEDILCIFKDDLAKLNDEELAKRSWCG